MAEVVDRRKVFERDGYRCQVCGRKTPKRLRGTNHPRAPELDHRVPMARGGAHIYENVQCCCRSCNSKKGSTKVVGQLPLFARETPDHPANWSGSPLSFLTEYGHHFIKRVAR